MSRLHRRVNDIRTHHLHCLTTRLAKTHGLIVVEGLDAAGMLRQKGLPGARARRRGLSDAALGTPAATSPIRRAGTGRHWWSPTGGTRHRKPATPAGMFRTSAGTNTDLQSRRLFGPPTSVTTTPPSTSHATRKRII